MKLAFTTCVRLGEVCIEEIYESGAALEVVFTLRDDVDPEKSGRVNLDDLADKFGFDLVKIKNVNEDLVLKTIRDRDIDWLFVVGWSQLVRKAVLGAPKRGVLGIHPTLLPEGRGRAPIPWAILKGLEKTGVTLFKIDEGVDSGPIISQKVIVIDPRETASTLYSKVEEKHRELIRTCLPYLESDSIALQDQDEGKATYWPARKPEDGEIKTDMTVEEVDRLVRAVTKPYPGAFFKHPELGVLRIWRGKPVPPSKGGHEPPKGYYLTLRDGKYKLLEWETTTEPEYE